MLRETKAKDYHRRTTASGRGVVGDGLTGDHIPSRAATVRRFANEFGDLSEDDFRFIKNESPCVIITSACHVSLSETLGGRNKDIRIIGDANDVLGVINSNFGAIIPGLRRAVLSTNEIEVTRRRLISDYEDFLARANERLGTNVTL